MIHPKTSKYKGFILIVFLIIICISPFLISTKMLFLKDHPVWPDESLFFDASSNWQEKGVIATNLYNGTALGLERKALWPPLYFFLTGILIRSGFTSIEQLRFISFSIAMICIPLLYIIFLKIYKRKFYALLGILLVSSDLAFGRAARVGRMEILVFLFMLGALLSFILYLEKRDPKLAFLSGVGTALAVLTHTMGVMIAIIFILYIFIRRNNLQNKFRLSLAILTPVIIGLSWWIAINIRYIDLMINQYLFHIGRRIYEETYLVSLLKEQIMYIPIVTLYILVFTISCVYTIVHPKRRNTLVMIGLIVSTFFVLYGKEMWYVVYLQPFMTMALLQLIQSALGSNNRFLFLSGIVLMVVQFTAQTQLLGSIARFYGYGSENYSYHKFTRALESVIPRGAGLFIASIPDSYFDLKANHRQIFAEPAQTLQPKDYKLLIENADYAIINLPSNPVLTDYLEKNKDEAIEVSVQNNYQALVIKLVPREKRR